MSDSIFGPVVFFLQVKILEMNGGKHTLNSTEFVGLNSYVCRKHRNIR